MMRMKHNNAGRAAGLTLVLLLIVALIVAYLAVMQFTSIRKQPATDLVQQAQDAVDAINQAQQQARQAP